MVPLLRLNLLDPIPPERRRTQPLRLPRTRRVLAHVERTPTRQAHRTGRERSRQDAAETQGEMEMPAWIAGGAAIAGGLIGAMGQESTNAANEAINTQTEQWETQMSNTAMQRRVTDLQLAGLNPILAVSQGGASTPGMSPLAMQNPGNQLGQGIASAGQAYVQAQNTAADTNLKNATAAKVTADTIKPGQASAASEASTANLQSSANSADANVKAINQQIEESKARITKIETDIATGNITNQTLNDLNTAKLNMTRLEAQSTRLGLPVKALEGWTAQQSLDIAKGAKNTAGAIGTSIGSGLADISDRLAAAEDAIREGYKKFTGNTPYSPTGKTLEQGPY